jgi:hypothetical protein
MIVPSGNESPPSLKVRDTWALVLFIGWPVWLEYSVTVTEILVPAATELGTPLIMK